MSFHNSTFGIAVWYGTRSVHMSRRLTEHESSFSRSSRPVFALSAIVTLLRQSTSPDYMSNCTRCSQHRPDSYLARPCQCRSRKAMSQIPCISLIIFLTGLVHKCRALSKMSCYSMLFHYCSICAITTLSSLRFSLPCSMIDSIRVTNVPMH